MEVQTHVKQELKALGKTAADLSRSLGVPYLRVSHYLNGYIYPGGLESQVRLQLKAWKNENITRA